MSSILCKCGNRLSTSQVPNEVQYHVYSDLEWVEIMKSENISPIDLPLPMHDVWKCTNCSRLYVFSKEGKVVSIFKLEQD